MLSNSGSFDKLRSLGVLLGGIGLLLMGIASVIVTYRGTKQDRMMKAMETMIDQGALQEELKAFGLTGEHEDDNQTEK